MPCRASRCSFLPPVPCRPRCCASLSLCSAWVSFALHVSFSSFVSAFPSLLSYSCATFGSYGVVVPPPAPAVVAVAPGSCARRFRWSIGLPRVPRGGREGCFGVARRLLWSHPCWCAAWFSPRSVYCCRRGAPCVDYSRHLASLCSLLARCHRLLLCHVGCPCSRRNLGPLVPAFCCSFISGCLICGVNPSGNTFFSFILHVVCARHPIV